MTSQSRILRRLRATCFALPLVVFGGTALSPVAAEAAANPTATERGPLTGAESIRLSIDEAGAGELSFLVPLPDRRLGHSYPWSEAEVHTVRSGADGFCRVRVRRGSDDPAHDLEVELTCGRYAKNGRSVDLRLQTAHRFTRRKKGVVAEFSHPDGSRTTVAVAIR